MKITKKIVEDLETREKDYFVWDENLPGFGVRTYPTGRKVFVLQYKRGGRSGRLRRLAIGRYGAVTVIQARAIAQQNLAAIARGEDPAADKALQKKAPTVAELAETYFVKHGHRKKNSSLRNDRSMLQNRILPALGKKKVAAVDRTDIEQLHTSMRHTPYSANRCLALLNKMFNLAEKWSLRPDASNPCRHVEKFKEHKRERYLNSDELARLGAVLRKAEQDQTEDISGILAVRLLIFTGCRRQEILSLKWEYVDFENGCLRLPDSKTGAKIVPLAEPALDVLRTAPRLAGNPYVCPGRKWASHLVGLPRIWERISAAAGLSGVRLHDLRHSFASVGAGAGLGLPMIGALLGHTQAATTQRYAHLAVDPLKQAANQIVGKIAEAMNTKPKEVLVDLGGNVMTTKKGI